MPSIVRRISYPLSLLLMSMKVWIVFLLIQEFRKEFFKIFNQWLSLVLLILLLLDFSFQYALNSVLDIERTLKKTCCFIFRRNSWNFSDMLRNLTCANFASVLTYLLSYYRLSPFSRKVRSCYVTASLWRIPLMYNPILWNLIHSLEHIHSRSNARLLDRFLLWVNNISLQCLLGWNMSCPYLLFANFGIWRVCT